MMKAFINVLLPKEIFLSEVLGRKAKVDSKQLLFYIFDNGSIEKKIHIID